MPFDFRPVSPERVADYEALFRLCFPDARHLDRDYLQWLYTENPEGTVLGYDAWDEERLAAHYVCIPARASIAGTSSAVLLSLNTATAPGYQGQGLFTRLAAMTYERAAEEGYRAVYGVANANSTPGFVRKLGFTLVCPLDAWVGLGPLLPDRAWTAPAATAEFAREWSEAALAWRLRNPAAPVAVSRRGQAAGFHAPTPWPVLKAYAERPLPVPATATGGSLLRVFIGRFPSALKAGPAYVAIPGFLRPSPLNFIYRDLQQPGFAPDPQQVLLSFLDFDAF